MYYPNNKQIIIMLKKATFKRRFARSYMTNGDTRYSQRKVFSPNLNKNRS